MSRLLMAMLCVSCVQPTPDADRDAGAARCVENSNQPGVPICAERAAVVCGGRACASGEDCCLLNATCFNPSDRSACRLPESNPRPGSCASNSDCSPDELCLENNLSRCGGPGFCQPITNCGFCSGGPQCFVCGCDGVTYRSIQEACVAGVRVVTGSGVCATVGPRGISCGRDDQCGREGERCCALTGKCFAASEPWRCESQPDGSVLDCRQNSECGSGAAGAAGGQAGVGLWCAGESCGTPGRCLPRRSDCNGIVETVCGCDGLTYVNECWARAGGARVASRGACRDAGP